MILYLIAGWSHPGEAAGARIDLVHTVAATAVKVVVVATVCGLETIGSAGQLDDPQPPGFNEAFEGRGLCADAHLQSAGEMTESFGYHRAKELLARTDSPTAIFVSSILLAIGVQRAIGEAGLRMGKDISVVTHDDALSYLRNGDELPLFTATRSSVREAGMRCAEMLIERVKNPENALVQELWEAELILGQSTGRAPNSSL